MAQKRYNLYFDDKKPGHKEVMDILDACGRAKSDYVVKWFLDARQDREEVMRRVFKECLSNVTITGTRPAGNNSLLSEIQKMRE